MDELEKFIQNNRQAFDDKSPASDTWSAIESHLPGKRRQPMLIWKAAAAIFLATTIGLFAYIMQLNSQTAGVASLDEEFRQMEYFYLSNIRNYQETLVEFDVQDENELVSEMEILDSAYGALKKEYLSSGNEELRNAMIYNLQLRKDILEEQIELLKGINQDNNEDYSINI